MSNIQTYKTNRKTIKLIKKSNKHTNTENQYRRKGLGERTAHFNFIKFCPDNK